MVLLALNLVTLKFIISYIFHSPELTKSELIRPSHSTLIEVSRLQTHNNTEIALSLFVISSERICITPHIAHGCTPVGPVFVATSSQGGEIMTLAVCVRTDAGGCVW